jgi:hypothetical protein
VDETDREENQKPAHIARREELAPLLGPGHLYRRAEPEQEGEHRVELRLDEQLEPPADGLIDDAAERLGVKPAEAGREAEIVDVDEQDPQDRQPPQHVDRVDALAEADRPEPASRRRFDRGSLHAEEHVWAAGRVPWER